VPVPLGPVKDGPRAHPRFLLERPRIAALIGAIVVEWAYIENSLADVFERAGSTTMYRDDVSLAQIRRIHTLGGRISQIDKRLALHVVGTAKESFDAMIAEIRAASADRNMIAHGNWHMTDDFRDDLVRIDETGAHIRYTEQDYADIFDRVIAIRNKVHDFVILVHHAEKR